MAAPGTQMVRRHILRKESTKKLKSIQVGGLSRRTHMIIVCLRVHNNGGRGEGGRKEVGFKVDSKHHHLYGKRTTDGRNDHVSNFSRHFSRMPFAGSCMASFHLKYRQAQYAMIVKGKW